MSEKIEKKVLVLTLLFFAAAMIVMLVYDRQRVFLGTGQQMREENMKTTAGQEIPFLEGMGSAGAVVVPVPAGVGIKDVTVENLYREHEIHIEIAGMEENFLYENGIAGSLDGIEEYTCEKTERGVLFRLVVDSVYECSADVRTGLLYLELAEPSRISDRILLLDAGHGGTDNGKEALGLKEKEIVLGVAMELQEKLKEQGVLVYCTREGDVEVTDQERLLLMEETQADFCVSLHLTASPQETDLYGVSTYYSGTFFVDGFSGGDLAYTIGQALSAQQNVKGLGIFAGEARYTLLRDANIPTALVELGYLTNQKERDKLKKAAYQEELAEGLCNGILAAYEQKKAME